MTGERRCLVVRPEPGCTATVARVRALGGWRPVGVPLTERVGTGIPMPSEAFDAVVLTSAAAAPYLDALPRDVPVHCIGQATANAARHAGFTNVRLGTGRPVADGGALGSALAHSLRDRAVLYPCAEDRRPDLEREAALGGVQVLLWPVYRTAPAPDGEARLRRALDRPPDATLLHAPSTARTLAAAWPTEWKGSSVTWLTLSRQIADALPADLSGPRVVAETPDERALIARLGCV